MRTLIGGIFDVTRYTKIQNRKECVERIDKTPVAILILIYNRMQLDKNLTFFNDLIKHKYSDKVEDLHPYRRIDFLSGFFNRKQFLAHILRSITERGTKCQHLTIVSDNVRQEAVSPKTHVEGIFKRRPMN